MVETLCPPGSAPKNDFHTKFLADVKKSLGEEKTSQLFQAIRDYKKTDSYENLVSTVVSLLTERDEDFDLLIRKFKPFLLFVHGVMKFQCPFTLFMDIFVFPVLRIWYIHSSSS